MPEKKAEETAEELLNNPRNMPIQYNLASDALIPFMDYYRIYSDLVVRKYRTTSKDLGTPDDVIKVKVIMFGDFMAWLTAEMKNERNQV